MPSSSKMSSDAPEGSRDWAATSANRLKDAWRRLPGMPRIVRSGTTWSPGRRALEAREDALAGGLSVEQLVGIHRLVEAEALGEEAAQRDLPVRHEPRTLPLAHAAEGPRGHEGELLANQVAADVEGGGPALTHEAHAAPGGRALYRGHPRLGQPGAVHGSLRAFPVSQVPDRLHRIGLPRVHHRVGAQLPGQMEPLVRD